MKNLDLMQSTRARIMEILKKEGRVTVKRLSETMDMTSTGIRQHLAVLERDGWILSTTVRGGLGRPSEAFSLTEAAHELFPRRYHQLITWLLEQIELADGRERLDALFTEMGRRLAIHHGQRVKGRGLEDRVDEVTAILNEMGTMAEWRSIEGGYLIDMYNCPYWQVMRKYPQVCAMDWEWICNSLGVEVERREHFLEGYLRCRLFVPAVDGE